MRSFKDSQGRLWEIEVDVRAAKRCKGLLDLSIYGLVDDGAKGLADLLSDPIRLVDTIYVLCMDQCEARSISDEDFGRLFAGDVLEEASEAFVSSVVDFFPNRAAKASLRRLLAKGKEMGQHLLERADREIEAIDPASLAAKWKPSSGRSPDSLESTPTGERSAS